MVHYCQSPNQPFIQPDPVDIIAALEIVDFAQYEGKTTYDSFERVLVDGFIDSINRKTFSLGTELLIAIFLSRVDNFTNNYQQNIARKLTKVTIANFFIEFDASINVNARLIQTLVDRGIFIDNTPNYVTMQLMFYCKKLFQLQSAVSKSESAEKVIEYKFTPEEIVSQSTEKRKSADDQSSVPMKRLRR